MNAAQRLESFSRGMLIIMLSSAIFLLPFNSYAWMYYVYEYAQTQRKRWLILFAAFGPWAFATVGVFVALTVRRRRLIRLNLDSQS